MTLRQWLGCNQGLKENSPPAPEKYHYLAIKVIAFC